MSKRRGRRPTSALSGKQNKPVSGHRIPIFQALAKGGDWSRSDTLTAIGLFTALLAIIVPILASTLQSKSPGPALQVDDVEIALASKIDTTTQNPAEPPVKSKEDGSAIDITLRNTGEQPALITGAVFSFTSIVELVNCFGAGPGFATAEYDVKVPPRVATSGGPLLLRRDMRFVVGANSIDRFRISVGPKSYSLAGWPWVYEFTVTLDEDSGQTIDLGQMSTLGLTGSSWNQLSFGTTSEFPEQSKECVAQDAAVLAHAMNRPGLHSPELSTLYREAESLITPSH